MAAFQAGLLRPRMGRFIRTARQPRVLWFANRAFALLERVSRHKIAMCLLVMAVSLTLRLALLRSRPIPQPFVTDEYSYLLGAETFASGRLTNPMHPMWEHFETLHELVRPSYMSKYPPGQALFLALGWKLLGHPWYGVWLSFGLFSACLCWMLQNWVPPSYALLGTAIMLARISILGYWMNSYWGGAVAAAAGCLLFGALPRLARGRVKSTDVILASIALILLANTRPYEGLLLSAAAFLALLYWRRKGPRSLKELISPRCVVPLLLICGAAAALDGYYNYRVTGRALQMPYNAYFQQYQIASPWLIFREQNPPAYRHVDIENTWKEQDSEYREKKASLHVNLNDVKNVAAFFISPLYLFPIALAMLLSSSYRLWTAVGILVCVWSGLFIENTKAPHYVAASVGLVPLLVVYGLRWMRVIGREYGPVLVLTLAALLCLQGRASEKGQSWETRSADTKSPRMLAMKEAMTEPGRQLILVRYSAAHVDKSDECVYNSADIDSSQIVWAHDMGEAKNRELIDYYRGSRKVWLYQPDTEPGEIKPYVLGSE